MSIFEKKEAVRRRFNFVFLIVVLSAVWLAVNVQILKGERRASVTYVTFQKESQRLTAVELIRPSKKSEFYIDLQQAMEENGWKLLPDDSGVKIADRCIVSPLEGNDHIIWCGSIYQNQTVDALQIEIKDVQSAIAIISNFSAMKDQPSRIFGPKKNIWM